jgi:Protein of unknown function (DUF4065)
MRRLRNCVLRISVCVDRVRQWADARDRWTTPSEDCQSDRIGSGYGEMDIANAPPIRFRLNTDRCIQGIQWLAVHRPGITQFYVGIVFFFADKSHLLDWGRPISGDRYLAMEHGPVPSMIYDLLKSDSGAPDEIARALNARIRTVTVENRLQVFSLEETPIYPALSRTDKEYLTESLLMYGKMNLDDIRRICDKDPAYSAALALAGVNNELDLRLWFQDDLGLLEELYETSPVRRRA